MFFFSGVFFKFFYRTAFFFVGGFSSGSLFYLYSGFFFLYGGFCKSQRIPDYAQATFTILNEMPKEG